MRLAAALRKLGRPLGGVVACITGSMERGRLLDHPAAFLQRKFDEDVLPHLAAARHLLPLLAEASRGGGYVLIGGPGSEHPWAGYGHRSIGAAALNMLARVLHDEARALPVRVQLLAIDSPVCTEDNIGHACPQWPSALAVGQARAGADRPAARQGRGGRAFQRRPTAMSNSDRPNRRNSKSPSTIVRTNQPAQSSQNRIATPHCCHHAVCRTRATLLEEPDLSPNPISPNRNQEPSPHELPAKPWPGPEPGFPSSR